jgi:pimeloyl-ACP methyl ester carboxylesterase
MNPERFVTATVGGSAGVRPQDPKATEEYAAQIARGDFRGLIARTASTGSPAPSEESIRARSKEIAATADVAALAAMVRGRPALVVTEAELARVSIPTLAIVGTLDPNFKLVRAMKNVMPALQIVVIDGAAHGPTLRHPEFVSALGTFLSKHRGPSAKDRGPSAKE